MNTLPETTFVDSSQLTPVYLINPNNTQTNYVITLGDLEPKPVTDNLKSFYEKSGINIENAVTNVNVPKPRIVKKIDATPVGNNLKLASFLLPKNEPNKSYVLNNVILKPAVKTNNIPTTTNTVPVLDIDRKIVKLKDGPMVQRHRAERALPKIKPKDVPNPVSLPASKLTSVQLIKLGETYHSLNKLSNDQVKMVNHALKIFRDPEKIAPEPTYDPVTNTKFIYKVISPEDLVVSGKKNIILKEKKVEPKIEPKLEPKKEVVKKQVIPEDFEEEWEMPTVTKVTRSGRTVKLPKLIVPQDNPQKPKKKSHVVTCSQCSLEFASLYRLQKHYEVHPTHIPAKVHSNLFHCLLAIVKGGSEEDRTNIFVQQLEQLIVKLKSLLPCLLNTKGASDAKPCTINDDVGRILGMDPGKYNIDVNALNCVKDKDGYCIHNPPVNQVKKEQVLPQVLITNEEIANTTAMETEDCARISSAENWPTVNKRVWKLKKLKSQKNGAKKIKLEDSLLQLDLDVTQTEELQQNKRLVFECDDLLNKLGIDSTNLNEPVKPKETQCNMTDQSKKNNHIQQFHSTHFDIRSSPIKPTSTVFRKFQINPEKLASYDGQIIGAANIVDKGFDETNSISEILNTNIELPCKESTDQSWINVKSNSSFAEPETVIEPALLHIKDTECNASTSKSSEVTQMLGTDSETSNSDSVLNFLDSLGSTCLSYPGMEIRTSTSDFDLDLFTFSNT